MTNTQMSHAQSINSCLDCPKHELINDPDQHDNFCYDDIALVCTITQNPYRDVISNYASDRHPNRSVAWSSRPYNIIKEAPVPKWCPLGNSSK